MAELDVIQGLVTDVGKMRDTLNTIGTSVEVIKKELELQNISKLKERIESLERWRAALAGAFVLANIIWAIIAKFL